MTRRSVTYRTAFEIDDADEEHDERLRVLRALRPERAEFRERAAGVAVYTASSTPLKGGAQAPEQVARKRLDQGESA